MNSLKTPTPQSNEPSARKSGMKTPLIISTILHVLIFLFVIFGFPHWKKDLEIVDSVPVELVANVSELTTTNKPPVKPAPEPEKKDKEPPKKEEPKPPEPVEEELKPPEEELKDPPKPEEVVEKIPDEKPKEKPKEVKPPKAKKENKKEDKKPKNDANFDDLLKDLTPTESAAPKEEPSPNVSRFSNVISMSEMDALRQQLSQCWNIMAGAENSDDLRVEVAVVVNVDRTLNSAKVVDQFRYNSDSFYRAAADSALRALRNPHCTPLNLPPEKYDQWHEMTIVFDPKEMF